MLCFLGNNVSHTSQAKPSKTPASDGSTVRSVCAGELARMTNYAMQISHIVSISYFRCKVPGCANGYFHCSILECEQVMLASLSHLWRCSYIVVCLLPEEAPWLLALLQACMSCLVLIFLVVFYSLHAFTTPHAATVRVSVSPTAWFPPCISNSNQTPTIYQHHYPFI